MCRMVGIMATHPTSPGYELLTAPRGLLWLSSNGRRFRSPQGGPHGDGWGIAWREGGQMRLAKRGNPAFGDPAFRRQAGGVVSDLVIAHVRKASAGLRVCDENAHPFSYDGVVFAHNGDIDIRGEAGTDSERFLRWLAPRWDRTPAGLVSLLREARSLGHDSLTFLLSDGSTLYALRETRERPHYLEYYTLYIKESPQRVVFASEPVDDSPGWQEIGNGTLFMVPAVGKAERVAL